ncbi:hypothetical protein CLOHYLEM_05578 [[Clostridium] hylemonae DSM 15053]|uniref:Uncharacterized protein n=1 Tax=[Clostridium] hylemonae DSM 15053 TaxID=553973 RepID=C0C0I2_9FIRM|nr:hypothetical protein CLOHYLEM_05578 [[Clostridium] hylemonae DSM 15053]
MSVYDRHSLQLKPCSGEGEQNKAAFWDFRLFTAALSIKLLF